MTGAKKSLPEGYKTLTVGGGKYDIVIREKTHKDILKHASAEQRAGLDDVLARYAKNGPAGVPPKKYNGQEGWFPSDKAQNKIRLEALKPWQLRAYGFCRDFNGRPTLFITGVDTAKKQDRANQSILKAAGGEAFRLNELLR
ncbi:MAG: hypothetical protein ACXW3D_03380 [Caulobacteraceae bacterium]